MLLAVGLLAAAFVLRIAESGLVELPLLGIEMPGLCTWQQLFGVNCPFCGLTRCFVSAAHGQFARAWHFHPVGLILFFAVLAQIRFIRLKRSLFVTRLIIVISKHMKNGFR